MTKITRWITQFVNLRVINKIICFGDGLTSLAFMIYLWNKHIAYEHWKKELSQIALVVSYIAFFSAIAFVRYY
jgi:hypothetical protein